MKITTNIAEAYRVRNFATNKNHYEKFYNLFQFYFI